MAQQMDKKKMAIFGILGASLLGVGVWQFTGSSKSSGPIFKDTHRTEEQANNNPEETTPDQNLLAGLTRKDPFVPGHLAQEPTAGLVAQNHAPAPSYSPPSRPTGPVLRPWGVGLPNTGVGSGNGNVSIDPSAVAQPAQDANSFDLVGVVDGPHPVAVFRSGSGTQKMVYLHGSVSQGVKVMGISHGRVTLSLNGKTKTLTVGGNSQ